MTGAVDRVATLTVAIEALEQAIAARDAALDALRGLLSVFERQGGYLSPEDMATLWQARALLVEVGG